MVIRKAGLDDISTILRIYEYARQQMRLSGNPDQWRHGYPSRKTVWNDIWNHNSYVITDGNEIGGVFVFVIGEDPTYKRIENGQWMNQDTYGTIHRLAGSGKIKGVFQLCQQFCESKISNIRADTHERNGIMRHLLEKNGYQKCGRIYTADGSPRIAYQKIAARPQPDDFSNTL